MKTSRGAAPSAARLLMQCAYDELAGAIGRAQASGATFDRLAGLTVLRKTLPIEGGLEITTYEIA